MAPTPLTVIVLRRIPFSETSLVLTLFSREVGKLQALAKGARRPKSAFEGGFDLLGLYRVVYLPKSGETLQLLTEGKLLERFRPERAGIRGVFAGYYVAELIDSFTAEMGPQPEIFDLAVACLRALQGPTPAEFTILVFEVGLLESLGHVGRFDACSVCGRNVPWDKPAKLTEVGGGLVCPGCHRVHHRGLMLSGPERKTLTFLQASARSCRLNVGSQLISANRDGTLPPEMAAEGYREQTGREHEPRAEVMIPPFCDEFSRVYPRIRGLVSHWICHYLGRRPKLFPYLERMGFFSREIRKSEGFGRAGQNGESSRE